MNCSLEKVINKPLSRDLQGAYKGLPSNRIRSNKKEEINKKDGVLLWKS